MIDFDGRVAIVTGAGKGLGRTHAQALAGRGAAVLVNNRCHPGQPATADAVVAAIRASGGTAVANYEAVETPGAGERIVSAALAEFGRVDLVVANAGWSEPMAFHRESLDHIRRMLDVNALSALDLVRAAIPHLRAQQYGRIVVSTSSAAIFGDAGFVSYATAKSALTGFVSALSHESVLSGVTVNALLPFAHTPMTRGLFEGETFPDGAGEVMTPEAVSAMLLWLLSEQCRESGHTWLAGGRAFRKVVTAVTPGVVIDTYPPTPESIHARAAEIADPIGAVEFGSGADLLTAMTESSMARPRIDRRRLATFHNPRSDEYCRPGGPWFEQTMCRLLLEAPDRADLICGETSRYSTAELRASVRRVAAWLHQRGVRPGDAVGWQLKSTPDVVLLYLATWWMGAVAVPFHDSLTMAEARRVIECVNGLVVLVADPELPLASEADALLTADGFAGLQLAPTPTSPLCRPEDAAVVLTTSGSSGAPKSVIHSHRTLATKARQMSVLHGTTADDAVLVPAPLSHMAGLLHAVLHPLGTGAKAVIMPRWNAEHALELIRDERVTMMFGPPIYTLGVGAALGFTAEAVSSIRLVSSGATAITESYVRDVAQTFGAVVKRTYGSTECPIACTAYPGDEPQRFWSTDGRAAPDLELQIRDGEGRLLSAGETGEIWLRGPELCDGYLDADMTAETFVDGWMRTRDLGTIDGDGYLTVAGRVSGLIIRGGMNISSREIEAALESHPAISQAVVLGYDDDVYGERVAAFITSTEPFDRARCRDWFSQHGVAKYKLPDRIVALDAIPVLSTYQKPDLEALRQHLQE